MNANEARVMRASSRTAGDGFHLVGAARIELATSTVSM